MYVHRQLHQSVDEANPDGADRRATIEGSRRRQGFGQPSSTNRSTHSFSAPSRRRSASSSCSSLFRESIGPEPLDRIASDDILRPDSDRDIHRRHRYCSGARAEPIHFAAIDARGHPLLHSRGPADPGQRGDLPADLGTVRDRLLRFGPRQEIRALAGPRRRIGRRRIQNSGDRYRDD